ncbi:N-acetyltransferase [Pontibacter sp. KCTC 32443]|uniref:GNAT family N-acetyltransferase n=1 Tax=Pontibacter TaxID=323449 RepID=UPI00164E5CD9|nr:MULTISPECIES: GNAT family N-acetyltransferase [Pontibacter]MBC5772559.1 N-acetyltransferase [Pontibacter sp. KCTC 32443]
MDVKIVHEEKYQQFTVTLEDDEEAELAYAKPSEKEIDFTHTYVPESARGKGIAQQLIEEGLCFARDNGFTVIATCPVVAKYIARNKQHQDLLK